MVEARLGRCLNTAVLAGDLSPLPRFIEERDHWFISIVDTETSHCKQRLDESSHAIGESRAVGVHYSYFVDQIPALFAQDNHIGLADGVDGATTSASYHVNTSLQAAAQLNERMGQPATNILFLPTAPWSAGRSGKGTPENGNGRLYSNIIIPRGSTPQCNLLSVPSLILSSTSFESLWTTLLSLYSCRHHYHHHRTIPNSMTPNHHLLQLPALNPRSTTTLVQIQA